MSNNSTEKMINPIPVVNSPRQFSYENGILKRWAEAGCHTKDDVEKLLAGDKKSRETAKQKEKEQNIGFDLDEFFAAATLRGEDSSGS